MRKALLAMTAFVVALAATALPSGAGTSPMYTFEVDPTTGPAGTEVTFDSVSPCFMVIGEPIDDGVANGAGDTTAAIALVPDPDPEDFIADTFADELDGSWSIDYTIPGDTPPGDLTFYAFCIYDYGDNTGIPVNGEITRTYEPVTFSVTPPASTTTTTTSTSTTSTTAKPAAPTLTASPTTVFPGDSIAVQASGFAPGSSVAITIESDPVNLGSFVADSAGRIATNVVVPADFPAGNHTLKLTGTDIAGAVLVLSTGVTVASRIQAAPTTTAAPTVTPAATLPRTGSSVTGPALGASAALVLAGSVALLAARRRRADQR